MGESTDDLVTTVREATDRWRPETGGRNLQSYRKSLAEHLRAELDGGAPTPESVTVHRPPDTPDLIIGDEFGVLLDTDITGRDRRLRDRIDRFAGDYGRLLVVGVRIHSEPAWEGLVEEYESGPERTVTFVPVYRVSEATTTEDVEESGVEPLGLKRTLATLVTGFAVGVSILIHLGFRGGFLGVIGLDMGTSYPSWLIYMPFLTAILFLLAQFAPRRYGWRLWEE